MGDDRREIALIDQHLRLGMVEKPASSAGVSRTFSGITMARIRGTPKYPSSSWCVLKLRYATRSPGTTPSARSPNASRSQRSPNSAYVKRRGPLTHANFPAVKIHRAVQGADRRQGHIHDLRLYQAGWRGAEKISTRRRGEIVYREIPQKVTIWYSGQLGL